MLSTLIEKELKSLIMSPKFTATFAVCSLLVLLSVFIGAREYRSELKRYETALQLTEQEILEEDSWWGINNRAYRKPQPMHIFVSGINNDVGRLSDISTWYDIKLKQSHYSSDTIFAVFRFIDFTFIVQIVLSLFAILFTYDAISGERESGTLKLSLSNAVPRAKYVFGKLIGSWLGLTIPLLIPILLGLLLVVVLGIPLASDEWLRIATLVAVSVLYFTVFIALGVFVSAMTKRSAVSFLILLVIWVALVLIVPRGATMTAGQFVNVPTVAEVESKLDRFSTDRWMQYRRDRRALDEQRETLTSGMTSDERSTFRAANRDVWIQEESELRAAAQDEMADYSRRLNEELNNQKARRERLAFRLSRFSPASAYQLAVMNLAGTSTSLKTEYEESMADYRGAFATFVDQKRNEERLKNRGRRRSMGSDNEPLDVSELPRYVAPETSFEQAVAPAVVDMGLLLMFSIVAFAGSFVAFLRYDVR